ncbi:DUF4190 domain-containing protein [Xanthomonadaceae bacterium JHOS43]|nr:DUF4190 domain-containing protein [Xanthomonadaceae bacterium JHOS43]MCX7563993.1 DUF4190 domain-containing protein [Xanthomonadaceae bacterium XH05]
MNLSVPARQTSALAIVSLICGVVSWVLLPLLGAIVAVVTGHMARSEIRGAPERLEGDGLAIAGMVLGYLQLALLLLGVLFIVAILLFFGGLAALSL